LLPGWKRYYADNVARDTAAQGTYLDKVHIWKRFEVLGVATTSNGGRIMARTRTNLLAWSIGALTMALVLGQAHAQDTNIRFLLDWKFEGEQSQFTVPLEDGTFKRYHLNVQMDGGMGSGDTVTKVAGGAYDMGCADLYAMVRFNGANPNHRLIAVAVYQDISAIGVSTMANSGITKPKDLEGKNIAAPADAGQQLFPLFASLNHINSDSIRWSSVSANMRDTLLIREQVDAVTGNVVTTIMNSRAMGVPDGGVRGFIYAKYGVPLYGSAIITTQAYADAHPEAIRDFIRGIAHGLNVMITDPQAALATVKKYDPLLDDKIELARLKLSLEYYLITEHVLKYGLGQVDMARLQLTLDVVAPAFGINPMPKASDVYTDKYLPPAEDLKIASWHPGQ
jgi:NitT/TauT family transport system substrate-binding protein